MRIKLRGMSVVASLAITVSALTMLSTTAPASAATYASPGVGQWFNGGSHHRARVYGGDWVWHGDRNYWCSGFTEHAGDGVVSNKITGRIPGYTAANSTAAKKLINSFNRSNSAKLNAERAMAVWYLSSDRNFHADWKHAYVPQLKHRGEYGAVMSMVSWAKTHGPYRVNVTATHALVGQPGTVTVKVTGSNGRAASKLPVSVNATNVNVSGKTVQTSASGIAKFAFRRTDVGSPHFTAQVTAPSSTAVRLTDASPGRQRLLSGNYTEHRSGSYSYGKSPSGPSVAVSCTTQCNGVANVSWTKGVESGSSPMRYEFYTNGDTRVAQCDASAGHTCTASAKLTDGTVWTSYRYCYLNKVGGSCTTSWTTVKEHKEIICPAWVQWTIQCPCSGATVLTLTAPESSPRFYTVTVTYGTTSKTVNLVNGTPLDVALTGYKSGQEIAASFSAYRDSGHTQALKEQELFSGLKLG